MNFTYSLSVIMKNGHRIAKDLIGQHSKYVQCLSRGLKKAWMLAKGLVPSLDDIATMYFGTDEYLGEYTKYKEVYECKSILGPDLLNQPEPLPL